MRKIYSAVLLICIVAFLSPLAIPAVHANPTSGTHYHRYRYVQRVEGFFDYTWMNLTYPWPQPVGDNLHLYAIEYEWWEGSFTGTSTALFIVIMFEAGAGSWSVDLISTFTGTVDGKEGTLVLLLVGEKPADGEWRGHWEILRGTGELANVRGFGIWGGPGYEGPDPPVPVGEWNPAEGSDDYPNYRPDIWFKGWIYEIRQHQKLATIPTGIRG
ncbi:MAG: DUF3224 domain-containing protein [Candidatus Hodarchaeota archaeon]